MARKTKSYLQISRESKNLSREVVAAEACMDNSTLVRYDNDPAKTPCDAMNVLIDVIGDEYIGYLYLMSNPVARRFIPGGVRRMTLQEAILGMAVAGKNLYERIQDMMEIALDGEIDEEEEDKWLEAKELMQKFIKSYIALECADGVEI